MPASAPCARLAGEVLGVLLACLLAAGCTTGAPPESGVGATVSAGPSASAGAPTDLARRAAHTMTALPGGGLLVAGGCVVDGCGTATTSAYVLDGVRAEPTGPLGQPRDAHTATALPDGRVLVTGGFTAEGRAPLSSAEVYDPQTRRWTSSGSLRTARGGHAAGLLGDGRVLVAGGWVGYHTFTESTEIFDPATGRFARDRACRRRSSGSRRPRSPTAASC